MESVARAAWLLTSSHARPGMWWGRPLRDGVGGAVAGRLQGRSIRAVLPEVAGPQEPAPAFAGVGTADSRIRGKDGLGWIPLGGRTLQPSWGLSRTIAKLFDSRRRPRRWQDSKSLPPQKRGLEPWIPAPAFVRVTFFRGKDGVGQIPLGGRTLQPSWGLSSGIGPEQLSQVYF